jgi:hypothetical protein
MKYYLSALIIIFALLASTFANAQQQQAKDTTAPDYTLAKRNTKDSIRIDVSKIYQGSTLIGTMSFNETHQNNNAIVVKLMVIHLPNKTKIAVAQTDPTGDIYQWQVFTTKDKHTEKVTTHKGQDKTEVLWYLIKGSYL